MSYLKDISERAIKIDDPIILEALFNIGAISCSEEEEEAKLLEKVKDIEAERQEEK